MDHDLVQLWKVEVQLRGNVGCQADLDSARARSIERLRTSTSVRRSSRPGSRLTNPRRSKLSGNRVTCVRVASSVVLRSIGNSVLFWVCAQSLFDRLPVQDLCHARTAGPRAFGAAAHASAASQPAHRCAEAVLRLRRLDPRHRRAATHRCGRHAGVAHGRRIPSSARVRGAPATGVVFDQLLTLTQGRDAAPLDRSIELLVSRLRQRLRDAPPEPRHTARPRSKGQRSSIATG